MTTDTMSTEAVLEEAQARAFLSNAVAEVVVRRTRGATPERMISQLTVKQEEALLTEPWVAALPIGAKQALMRSLGLRHLQPGDLLLEQGRVSDHWYGVASGALRLQSTLPSGKQIVLAVAGPGEWFGDLSVLGAVAEPFDAEARCPTTVVVMHRLVLRGLLATHPELAIALLQLATQRHLAWINATSDALTMPLQARLADQLLRLADRFGEQIDDVTRIKLRLTQTELGGLINASRQRVNLCLAELRRNGVVSLDSQGFFCFRSRSVLRRYSQIARRSF
jgi:CRP/FNR family cyclic AMP-dependent transcriptional regulator